MAGSTATAAAPSRRERKKERTRHEIHAAAMRLFAERGFDAVTIDEICTAADVARATFFLHFPTKDALLNEYARNVTDQVAAALAEHRGSAVEGLQLALELLAERAQSHAGVVQLVVREMMARPAAVSSDSEESRELVGLLAGIIRRGQAAGELRRRIDANLAAGVVVVAYLALVAEWTRLGVARGQKAIDLRVLVKQALDLILNGLVTRPPAGRTRR